MKQFAKQQNLFRKEQLSGEALSFLSTGIDTRVYFIKNF